VFILEGLGQCFGSGSGTRDPGLVKNKDPDPRAWKPFFGLKYVNSLMQIRDPGWKKFGSGMEKFAT
jgi:hypothetical protein